METSPPFERGDPAPWFKAPALSGSPQYAFDTVAGRHVLLLFFENSQNPAADKALKLVARNRSLFDDAQACFFGVTCTEADATNGRISQQLPGIRFFLDFGRGLSTLYRSSAPDGYRPQWVLLDPALRVLGTFPVDKGKDALALLRSEIAAAAADTWAPVLLVSNVLPPELCAELVRGYEADGGAESGFMREVGGKTVPMLDPDHKQRRDWVIPEGELRQTILRNIERHLTVPLRRAFQFTPTRIERYIIGCYDAGAGHFRPHRDNTTKGTAHRKFAVSLNLNAGDYDGGDLRFPEFGQRTYRPPTGGAVVFSCSLLHEATPVTRGRRYALLPFLYDEEGARLRESNNAYLDEKVGGYTPS